MATDWSLLFAPNSISEMPKLINAANQATADRAARIAMANQQAYEMDLEREEKKREYEESGKAKDLAAANQANASAEALRQQAKAMESEPARDVYKAQLSSGTSLGVADIGSQTQLATTGMQTGTQLEIEDRKNKLLMQQMALQQANLDREAKLKEQEIGISQQQANTSSAAQQNQGLLIGSQVMAAQGALDPMGHTMYPNSGGRMALDGSFHPIMQQQSNGPNLGVPGVDKSWTLQQSNNAPSISNGFNSSIQQQSVSSSPWALQQGPSNTMPNAPVSSGASNGPNAYNSSIPGTTYNGPPVSY